ncbi:MAG: hypothetical protein IJL15_00440 [Clostridia bacterium]|nr:hypothetical protein [Clostridia bacterium]
MRFSSEQAKFLKDEFHISVEAGTSTTLSKEEWQRIKDLAFDIEGEEALRSGELTERGRIAVSICDMEWEQ